MKSDSLFLRLKLSVIVLVATCAVMGTFGYVAVDYLNRWATEESVRQLTATNRLIRDLIHASQEGMRIAVGKLGDSFQTRFFGHFKLHREHRVTFDGAAMPYLSLNGQMLNLDFSEIDDFSRASGGNAATIFARDGDDFVRVTTTLTREDGSRAVGTPLGQDHPAYSSIMAGKPYRGHARLFGRHYATEYRPVVDLYGEVIGILFVGMELTANLDSLRKTLREFVIGDTGYVVVVDAEPGPTQGQLIVHPTKEGWNPRVEDPGSAAARIVEATLHQRRGISAYQWTNDENGESAPRQKISAMDEYPELNWIVITTAYLDEIQHPAMAGRHYLAAATVIAALFLVVVLNLFIGRMVLAPMWREIRERKRAEQARNESEARLRESEARYRLLLENSPVGIMHFDTGLIVNYCNQRIHQFLQAPPEYLQGLDCKGLKDPSFIPALRAALKGRLGIYEGPYQTSFSGQILEIAMHCAPLRNDAGEIVGGVAIIQDITERRQKDREIERYRDHLEELVEARTADLAAARAEAERLAKAKSDFLANMSHEIRTPLTGILGMTELILETRLSAPQRQYLTLAHSSAASLLTIINDILDFSRIEAGKLKIEEIPFDLALTLEEAMAPLTWQARLRGNVFDLEIPQGGPLWLMGDPTRIRQIIINLVGNAIKFTENGKIVVRLEWRRSCQDWMAITLSVRDNGVGIAPDKLKLIFEAFTQGDSSISRRFGGTGLGLFISNRLAHLMGGRVEVESVEGEGSCFTLFLELPRALPVTENREIPSGATEAARKLSVLLAEDAEINRVFLSSVLGKAGHRVTVCDNGEEAVAMATKADTPFDAILMDVQMPVMDGFTATRMLREKGIGTPIIALTAHVTGGFREQCLACGMNDYISKPVDTRLLLAKLEQSAPADLPASPPAPSDGGEQDGLAVLDREAALERMDGDESLYLSSLDMVNQQIDEDLQAMDDALARGDMQSLAGNAHRLKGSLSAIGADRCHRACWELEQGAARQDLPSLPGLSLALKDEVARLRSRIGEYCEVLDNQN